MQDGRDIYRVSVPNEERLICDDTPEEYCVSVPPDGKVSCIVYGRYGRRWVANVSARWLVRHLLKGQT